MKLKKLSINMLALVTALSFGLTPVCSAAGEPTAPQTNQQQPTQAATVPAAPGSPQAAVPPQANTQVPGSNLQGFADNTLSQVIQEAASKAGETPKGIANPVGSIGVPPVINVIQSAVTQTPEMLRAALTAMIATAESEKESKLLVAIALQRSANDLLPKMNAAADDYNEALRDLIKVEAAWGKGTDPVTMDAYRKAVQDARERMEKAKAIYEPLRLSFDFMKNRVKALAEEIKLLDQWISLLKALLSGLA